MAAFEDKVFSSQVLPFLHATAHICDESASLVVIDGSAEEFLDRLDGISCGNLQKNNITLVKEILLRGTWKFCEKKEDKVLDLRRRRAP